MTLSLILKPKKDFNSELNGWKNQIEREIRKSDEYDNVVSEIETVLTKIKDKRTAGCAQSNEIKEVSLKSGSIRTDLGGSKSGEPEYETLNTGRHWQVTGTAPDARRTGPRCPDTKTLLKLEAELRSLKGRVEVLENLGSELSDIESEIQPNEPSQELVGFQTLKIIKNICEKELNDFERTR